MKDKKFTFSTQKGEKGHCFMGQIWDENGDSLAVLDIQESEEYANHVLKIFAKAPEILEALKDLQERVIRCRTILEDGHGGDWNILDTKKSESLLNELK